MTAPVKRIEFETADRDLADEFLVSAYGTSVRTSGTAKGNSLGYSRADAGPFVLDQIRLPTDFRWDIAPLGRLLVARVDGGLLERECGGVSERFGPGDVLLVADPALPYSGRTHRADVRSSMLDLSVLTEVATGPVRFTGFRPVSVSAGQQWQHTLRFLTELLSGPPVAPLVVGNAARLLAAVALAAFPNTAATDPTIEDRHDASTTTVRRAVAFIEDNAASDISAADIAAAASVTIRAVQLAFRRHRDTTPMAYLRQVRLDQAHRELCAADPARETVTAVAARWGFASASRFTAHYRAAFGVLPSHTLRKR